MKWCLVIAGLKDLQRPAEKLSFSQNFGVYPFSVACTILIYQTSPRRYRIYLGAILTRYHPRELQPGRCAFLLPLFVLLSAHTLFQVNFCVGMTGVSQLYRVWESVLSNLTVMRKVLNL